MSDLDLDGLHDCLIDLGEAVGDDRDSPANDLSAFLSRLADACRSLAADPAVASADRLSCATARDLLTRAVGPTGTAARDDAK